ncbi:MAG: filamentous hemagglutinin N-terminal domain-containing protein [Oxalobacter sp.]|nr:MAG: filamentous hemagglutinin N-terminal domain-containing protein [Oxalobacter sp.]
MLLSVAERARTRKKRSGALLLSAALLANLAQAQQLPTGGQIVAGQGNIASAGSTMTVTQNTANMAVNWQSFSIAQGNTVNFVQPSASAVALNRVLGSDISVIQGALKANGKIFLINPNGVLFTPTAQVNVGSLVASTLNLYNADFMAGNYRFEGASSNAITNQGNITTANGGTVALIAARIVNTGKITAPQGKILMAAGSQVTLDLGGPVKIQIEEGALNAVIEQGGGVRADGGLVYLTAKAAGELATAVINHTGITEASSLTEKGGMIVLEGDRIQLADTSRIAATGTTGGGEVYVGGGWQGSGDLRQATTVTLAQGASIDVSATQTGNGGTAVLWSDIHNTRSQTRAHGTIWAKGGAESGNGGRIETSGHWLNVSGLQTATTAPQGHAGLWLLDPFNITISNGTSGTPFADTPGDDTYTSATTSSILASDIAAALGNGNVTIRTGGTTGDLEGNGNITVASSIAKTTGGETTLTLKAHGNIIMEGGAGITSSSDKLNTILWADSDGLGQGGVMLRNGSTINTNGGHLWIGGGNGSVAWNGLTVGNGYARGNYFGLGSNALDYTGILLGTTGGSGISLLSQGGDIALYGENSSNANNHKRGIFIVTGLTMNSGTGKIGLYGKNSSSITTADALYKNAIEIGNGTAASTTITSASTAADAITIQGDASTADTQNPQGIQGVQIYGGTVISATAGGGISITGKTNAASTASDRSDVTLGSVSILSNGGAIIVTGQSAQGIRFVGDAYLGYKAGTLITASSSNISLVSDKATLSGTDKLQSSGALTIKPYTADTTIGLGGGAGTLQLAASYFNTNFTNGFSSITVGDATAGAITFGGTTTFWENTTLRNNATLAINGAVTANDNMTLTSNGAISQTGALSVTGTTTITAGDANNVTLTNVGNSFTGAVSVVSGNNVAIIDSNALTLGAVIVSGTVDIATLTGNLTLTGAVTTTHASANAISLNASKNSAAGTSTGGNLLISGGSVNVGAGGTAQLYSGSLSGSTGLAALIGSGTGNFRYNADETTNFSVGDWTALGAGRHAIYREQPNLTVTANNATKIHDGAAYSGGNGVTHSGLINGDTAAAALGGTLTYGGTSQGAITVGTYDITPGGYTSKLGYALSYVDGRLTITVAPPTRNEPQDAAIQAAQVLPSINTPLRQQPSQAGVSEGLEFVEIPPGTDGGVILSSVLPPEGRTQTRVGNVRIWVEEGGIHLPTRAERQ